jgi:hypothetical protein
MPPPNEIEAVLFWAVGTAITIFAGGVMIYSSYFHLW